MNKKGFTLVELLATVVIMGIIMTLAFPSIMGMIESNNQRKYEAFEKSMTEYAKAYLEDETNIIGLSTLKQHGLTGIDDECIGYVLPNNQFQAYLQCGDSYESTNFNVENAS